MAQARAKSHKSKRVEGRTWEGDDLIHDASAHGGLGDAHGFSHFTAEEVAEDYGLPLEFVAAQLLEVGVPNDKLRLAEPLKRFCSKQQLQELVGSVGSADPIAVRETLVDLTLREFSETGEFDTLVGRPPPDHLLALCQRAKIAALLGVESRILQEDYAKLRNEFEHDPYFSIHR